MDEEVKKQIELNRRNPQKRQNFFREEAKRVRRQVELERRLLRERIAYNSNREREAREFSKRASISYAKFLKSGRAKLIHFNNPYQMQAFRREIKLLYGNFYK